MPQEEEKEAAAGAKPSQQRGGDGAADSDLACDRLFTQFCEVTDLGEILSSFRALCRETGADAESYEDLYPALKRSLTAWKPQSIWQLLDQRAALPEYATQLACRGRRVLVVGAGPVGLRLAVEAALLGARVDLVEKRDSFSRNNSLHLWPFLITDLRNLCAKKFYGKFASGSLDHICIRILQGVLLKVCLLLGVRVHISVTFTGLIEPANANTGWKVSTKPSSCPVNAYEFDAVLAADGKKNSLPGFRLKEFRAKLALAITANFVNNNTQQENSVPEISGVAYVYRQDFFNSLAEKHGIELENIVYYKDETHYFVMTAKKPSLLKKGVLKQDYNDPKQLLSPSNIDQRALKSYAVEAATYSTDGALSSMKFERNHRGEDDVALFDFTSLFASENAARIVERKGRRILLCVAGDSLIEPFWPTGSGCARGFLGAFDAAWMLKRFCSGTSPLELVEEREAIFYLLPQTTPDRLHKNLSGYTIDPKTRYLNLSELVPPGDVSHLFDTDNPSAKSHPSTSAQQTTTHDVPKSPKETTFSRGKSSSVSGGLSWFRQRSRSTEGLNTIAESTPPLESAPPAHLVGPSAQPQETQEQLPASGSPGFLRKHIQAFEAKDKNKPAQKEQKKKEGSVKQEKRAAVRSHEVSPKLGTVTGKARPPESPKSQPRGGFGLFSRLRSRSPSPGPGRGQREEGEKKAEKGREGKGAAEGKEKKVPQSQDQVHVSSTHPLTASKPVESGVPQGRSKSPVAHTQPPKEGKGQDGGEAQRQGEAGEVEQQPVVESVAEIVKRLDPQPAAAETGGKKGERGKKGRKDEKMVQQEDKSKKKEKEKKKKHPPEAAAKESGEKEEQETAIHKLLSLFKPKKSYDVAKATSSPSAASSSPKLKKKKKKGEKEVPQKPASEAPPLSVQDRIQRLRDLGVGVSSIDGPLISLEELEALEAASGIGVEERGEEEEGRDSRRDIRSRSVSPEELLESESGRSRSASPGQSAGEGERSQSKTSYHSLEEKEVREKEVREGDAGEGGEEGRKEISVEDGDEHQLSRVTSVEETVRKLDPFFLSRTSEKTWKPTASAQERKSKEFELAELHSKSKADTSNPLWLARIIQGIGRSLERLRKEQNDILVTKTTLQIINTILSNVQQHPDDDTYRRVRVSSQRFNQKVWQFSDASQFLARAGWVEIGDYIVLPMGQTVDIAKRVLEKHLNIVNQMLWSQQLELPDSPGVLKKLREKGEGGGVTYRARTINSGPRQSYSSRLVDESLRRVEKDQEAMAAALGKMANTVDGERDTSPDPFDPSQASQARVEEVQTMRAASAARSQWMERQKKESTEQRREREYKLILESELYDLPQASVGRKVSSPIQSITPSPPLTDTSPRPTSPLTTSPLTTSHLTASPSTAITSQKELSDEETLSPSQDLPVCPPQEEKEQEGDRGQKEEDGEKDTSQEETSEATVVASDSAWQKWAEKLGAAGTSSPTEGVGSQGKAEIRSQHTSNVHCEGLFEPAVGKGTEVEDGEGERRSLMTTPPASEPTLATDAQYSTPDSIKHDMRQYEKITLEAAAQVRQKWMEA